MIVTDNSETLKNALARIEQLERENAALLTDARRIDWLADVNSCSQVLLPKAVVEANIHSLRDAIDAAMKEKA